MSSPGIGRPASSSHGACMPCTESSNGQPWSPTFLNTLSSPTSSYVLSRPASSSSVSSGSSPLTPQSPFSAIKGTRGKEAISPDTILQHYMNVTRRLTENRPSRAASPCPSPSKTRTRIGLKEMEAIGYPASTKAQAPAQQAALDWPPPEWITGGTLALDELPDSDICTLPEYQLTQEWLEETIRSMTELEEEKQVEEEIEVDIGANMDVDVEMELGVVPRGVKRTRKHVDW